VTRFRSNFNTRKRIYHGLVICNHVIVEDNLRQAVQDTNCYKLNSLERFISFLQQLQIQKQDINRGHLLNIRFLKNNLKIPKSNRNSFSTDRQYKSQKENGEKTNNCRQNTTRKTQLKRELNQML
jgi:hypothetical protein